MTDSAAPGDDALAASQRWQRLSPASILYFVVKIVAGFAKNGIQNVAILGGIAVAVGDNLLMKLGLVGTAMSALLLVAALLSYLKFRFRVADGAFLIEKGVIQKKRLTLSFDRIQNVAIRQPLYFRPFGLVVLALESAGSASEEVSLGGIPRPLADAYRKQVLARETAAPRRPAAQTETDAEPISQPSRELLRLPISELVRYGLSNNNIWVVFGVTTGAFFQAFEEWEQYAVGFVNDNIVNVAETAPVMLALLAAAGVFALFLLLLAFSVIGAIIVNYDFRLTLEGDRYHRTRGLLEKQETSLPVTKVQSLRIKQPWPALLMNRFHMVLKQVGFDGPSNGAGATRPTFLVPSATRSFWSGFAQDLFDGLTLGDVAFQSIHKAYISRFILYYFGLPSVALAAVLSYFHGPTGLLTLAVPILLLPFIMLRHRRYGYWSDGAHGVVKSGFLGNSRTVFAFRKVQHVKIKQSPGQRSRDLATLRVKLAGQTVTLPYIPLRHAEAWRDRILYKVESSTAPWM